METPLPSSVFISVCPSSPLLLLLLRSVLMKNNTLQDMRSADVWGNKPLIVLELAILCAWLNCDVCIFTVSLQNTRSCLQNQHLVFFYRTEQTEQEVQVKVRFTSEGAAATSQGHDLHSNHTSGVRMLKNSSCSHFNSVFLDLNGESEVSWRRQTVVIWETHKTTAHANTCIQRTQQSVGVSLFAGRSNKSSNCSFHVSRLSHTSKVTFYLFWQQVPKWRLSSSTMAPK